MFVVLDGGVSLPVPRSQKPDPFYRPEDITDFRWKQEKHMRWLNAYTHCLYALHSQFEEPVHRAVNHVGARMLGVVDPFSIALRFIGEMQLAGYIDFHVQKVKGSKDKTERLIMPTDKLLGMNLGVYEAPPEAVVMPTIGSEYMSKAISVRHGVNNPENRRVSRVVSGAAEQKFTINTYVLDLIEKYRPGRNSESFKSEYMLERCITSANQLIGQEFRYSHFLDSRSRQYVEATCGVTPQGADWEKAVLTPVHEEVLTNLGHEALIEAALGYAEMPWTTEEMISHAQYPDSHVDIWMQADKPYSYMGCAKLLWDYSVAPERPLAAFVPLDGRCSGLQHWSALTRSQAITAHLGMEEDEHALDIYEKVAEDWKATLPEGQKQYATRKVAKIPVMTWGYNATRMTSMEWLDRQLGEKRRWCRKEKAFVVYEDGLERATAGRLGCDLYTQLNETLAELTTAVGWVSDCATIISKDGNPDIHWPTPDGFECKQRKVVGIEKDVVVILSDKSRFRTNRLDYSEQRPAHGKHRSAIAPNIIHSLDATHLRMVARELLVSGMPMVFVHDSFSTHVNYRDELYTFIVDTFAELYSGDWLNDLRGYWIERYSVELPEAPEQGLWDPQIVKNLKRFFI